MLSFNTVKIPAMKTKNIIYFLALVVGGTFTSCKRNYLDIVPTDRVPDVALLADSSLFEDYVIARYMGAKLQDKEAEGTPPGFGRGFEYAMWSALTDEAIYNNDDNTWLIQRGLIAPENTGIAGTIWGRSYRSIRECNYGLNNIGKVEMSTQQRNRLRSELHFIRAFRYQDLIRNYGGVVLVGDTVYNLEDKLTDAALYTKSSLSDCLRYAIAELDSAALYLPQVNDDSWKQGRATKGAALALKSRLLLYAASPLYNAGTWADAAAAAKVVMDMNQYSLADNYSQLFINGSSTEVIFSRQYVVGARHVPLELSNGPNGYNGWGGNTPLQNMVDAYEMNNGKLTTDPTSGFKADSPYANRDARLSASILYNGIRYRGDTVKIYTPGGKDSQDGPSNWNSTKTGYYLRKFLDDTKPIDNPWDVSGLQPWIYIRYAEVLLNYAEAQNEAVGPDGTVYNAVNLIRRRASVMQPVLVAGLSQSEMRDAIRRERQVELAFEEHRFYDVRRWRIAITTENIPAYGIDVKMVNGAPVYTRKVALSGRLFNEKNYWLPIPRTEIQASNNQLLQNTGY
jgi:hypothetical protein